MKEEELTHFFAYQPPRTEERRKAETAIALAALQLAEVIIKHCHTPEFQDKALWAAQQASMLATRGAALDEIRQDNAAVRMLEDMRRSRTVPPLKPP